MNVHELRNLEQFATFCYTNKKFASFSVFSCDYLLCKYCNYSHVAAPGLEWDMHSSPGARPKPHGFPSFQLKSFEWQEPISATVSNKSPAHIGSLLFAWHFNDWIRTKLIQIQGGTVSTSWFVTWFCNINHWDHQLRWLKHQIKLEASKDVTEQRLRRVRSNSPWDFNQLTPAIEGDVYTLYTVKEPLYMYIYCT